jgi:hypothetical protein
MPLGGCRRFDGAHYHGVERHLSGILGFGELGILIHHAGEQRRIERPPIDADPDWFLILNGHFDHGPEIVIGLSTDVHVSWIDAVFGQRAGAIGILLEKNVAVIVEIADDGHADAELLERIDDFRKRCRRVFGIDRHADQLRAGLRQRHHLIDRGRNIGRIGIGHGLYDNRMITPDLHTANVHHDRLTAGLYHICYLPPGTTIIAVPTAVSPAARSACRIGDRGRPR